MIRSVLALTMMGGAAVAQAPDVIVAVYTCERGVTVPVTYIHAEGFDSLAVIYVEGRQVAMGQVVSGSGAKYAAVDAELGYRWWSKGNTAMLLFQCADDMTDEIMLLSDCVIDVR